MVEHRRDPAEPDAYHTADRRGPVSAASYAGMGLQFVAAILLFLFAGQWLDERMGTSPLFVLLGVFLGAGGAFYSIYRRLMTEQAREEAERTRSRSGPT